MHRILACVVVLFAFVACSDEGASAPSAEEAKTCLEEAGFGTGETPGILSLTAEGKEIQFADQFMAIKGADEFAILIVAPGADAAAAAEALGGFMTSGGGTPLFETPAVNGDILLAEGVGASEASTDAVRACLGF